MATCKECFFKVNCAQRATYTDYHFDTIDEAVEKIGCDYFKDKDLIVELPCKVGDTVYEIVKKHNCTACYENGYDCDRSPMCFFLYSIVERKIDHLQSFLYIKNDCEVVLKQDCFLAKAEAEQKLKELKE